MRKNPEGQLDGLVLRTYSPPRHPELWKEIQNYRWSTGVPIEQTRPWGHFRGLQFNAKVSKPTRIGRGLLTVPSQERPALVPILVRCGLPPSKEEKMVEVGARRESKKDGVVPDGNIRRFVLQVGMARTGLAVLPRMFDTSRNQSSR